MKAGFGCLEENICAAEQKGVHITVMSAFIWVPRVGSSINYLHLFKYFPETLTEARLELNLGKE